MPEFISPPKGGGGGSPHWLSPVDDAAQLPASAPDGTFIYVKDQDALYHYDASVPGWINWGSLPDQIARIDTLYNTVFFKDGSETATGTFNMGTHSIVDMADPTNNQDAATKKYVDDGLANKQDLSEKGAANGYAPLDANSQVPDANVQPIYMYTYPALGDFPAVGKNDRPYFASSANLIYVYSTLTNDYVLVGRTPSSTDQLPEGSANLYHTVARARAAAVVDSMGSATDQAPSQATMMAEMVAIHGRVDTLDANAILRTGAVAFIANQSMGGNKLTALGTPTASTDAATKAYADTKVSNPMAVDLDTDGKLIRTTSSNGIRLQGGTSGSMNIRTEGVSVPGGSSGNVGPTLNTTAVTVEYTMSAGLGATQQTRKGRIDWIRGPSSTNHHSDEYIEAGTPLNVTLTPNAGANFQLAINNSEAYNVYLSLRVIS